MLDTARRPDLDSTVRSARDFALHHEGRGDSDLGASSVTHQALTRPGSALAPGPFPTSSVRPHPEPEATSQAVTMTTTPAASLNTVTAANPQAASVVDASLSTDFGITNQDELEAQAAALEDL